MQANLCYSLSPSYSLLSSIEPRQGCFTIEAAAVFGQAMTNGLSHRIMSRIFKAHIHSHLATVQYLVYLMSLDYSSYMEEGWVILSY